MKVKVIKPIPGYAYFGGEIIDPPTECNGLIEDGYLEEIVEENAEDNSSDSEPKNSTKKGKK